MESSVWLISDRWIQQAHGDVLRERNSVKGCFGMLSKTRLANMRARERLQSENVHSIAAGFSRKRKPTTCFQAVASSAVEHHLVETSPVHTVQNGLACVLCD